VRTEGLTCGMGGEQIPPFGVGCVYANYDLTKTDNEVIKSIWSCY
jgi:hypothetical protein